MPLALDLAERGAGARLPRDVDAVVACQAARGDSVDAYRRAYVEATRNLLEALVDQPVRGFVYTSSTGVFGQREGEEVDESTPVAPTSPTAEVLAEAEALVLDRANRRWPASVVRLSGLYGPGRIGTIDRVRSGVLALGPDGDTWMNFCHLQDAVGIVLAALDAGREGAVFHGSDAEPTRRRDVISWIAQQLGIAPQRGASSRLGRAANRRISSARTRVELGYTLRFPTFRDGFAPLLPRSTP